MTIIVCDNEARVLFVEVIYKKAHCGWWNNWEKIIVVKKIYRINFD